MHGHLIVRERRFVRIKERERELRERGERELTRES